MIGRRVCGKRKPREREGWLRWTSADARLPSPAATARAIRRHSDGSEAELASMKPKRKRRTGPSSSNPARIDCERPCDGRPLPLPPSARPCNTSIFSREQQSEQGEMEASTRRHCRDGEAADACWQCPARHAQIPRMPFATDRPEAAVHTPSPPRPLPVSTNASSSRFSLDLLPTSTRLALLCSPQCTYRVGICARGASVGWRRGRVRSLEEAAEQARLRLRVSD